MLTFHCKVILHPALMIGLGKGNLLCTVSGNPKWTVSILVIPSVHHSKIKADEDETVVLSLLFWKPEVQVGTSQNMRIWKRSRIFGLEVEVQKTSKTFRSKFFFYIVLYLDSDEVVASAMTCPSSAPSQQHGFCWARQVLMCLGFGDRASLHCLCQCFSVLAVVLISWCNISILLCFLSISTSLFPDEWQQLLVPSVCDLCHRPQKQVLLAASLL